MKYFSKLFIGILLVLTAALGTMEYFAVSFSREDAFQRELNGALSEHQLVKYSLETAYLRDGSFSRPSMENAAALLSAGGGLEIVGARGGVYYSNLGMAAEPVTAEAGISYRVRQGAGNRVLLQSESRFSAGTDTVLLVTQRDISGVFTQGEALVRRCSRLYLLLLAVCAALTLGLARALTQPLARLQKASRQIAAGNYQVRAKVNRRDELGDLARAYNRMADTIEEKIGQLEEAARRQERFTANFAHELKTPMTSIIGYADVLYQKKMTPSQVRQAAGYILNEGMRLEAMSFKLMDLFTLDTAKFTLEQTHMPDIFTDVGDTLLPQAVKRKVKLTVSADPGWCRLEYDLFKTLLLNLADNAMKSGGTAVSITGRAEGERYTVTVADNGRGIPTEELSRIQEAFYMVDKSRSRKEHGAGLGLTLAARIARLHKSELRYDSTPGLGTAVYLTLQKEKDNE